MNKVHLPSLNGIRAIAVMMVVLSHVDQFNQLLHIKSLGIGGLGLGWKGVVLFFTLSGFLITYLLQLEKKSFNKINIKSFYIRRLLRIWPLYYLIICITIILYFIFNDLIGIKEFELTSLSNFLLFLGNYEYVFGIGIITLTPLWSVAVEEQFYIFWPLLIAKFKNALNSVTLFLVFFLCIKLLIQKIDVHWYKLIYISSFSCMAIGAIMPLLLSKFKILMKIVFHQYFQLLLIILFLLLHFTSFFHFYTFIQREVFALVDGLIILNLAFNNKSIINLENSILNKIGVVSYGIYIYHMLVIVLIGRLLDFLKLNFADDNNWATISILFLVAFVSIIISIFSYNFIEKRFLLLKDKFALVKSSV